MARRFRKGSVNKIDSLRPLEEPTELEMLSPDKNPSEMPYQGFIGNQEYYYRMQSSCFEFDNIIKDLVEKKFSGNSIRNMTDENAIKAFEALENAKHNRTKQYIDLANHLSDDVFYRKMIQLEKVKAHKDGRIIDAEVVNKNDGEIVSETSNQENTEPIQEIEREKQQKIIRLLQEALVQKLDNENNA